MTSRFSFLEFFAGGGMARLGLGDSWRCLFANDIDPMKCAAYRNNFGGGDLLETDISSLNLDALPQRRADLMWGSFPCQDLSLAGARNGIAAKRSGLFFEFERLAQDLASAGIAPKIIALENVTGLLTSNDGKDFQAVVASLASLGYRVSAMVIDGANFTPQSRPRLFILGFSEETDPPFAETSPAEGDMPAALLHAAAGLSPKIRKHWRWLAPAPRPMRNISLSEIVDWKTTDWHTKKETRSLIAMMSKTQKDRLNALIKSGARRAGTGFRRTRIEDGESVQRFEARFDGIAGCLRTPAGGSSRQVVLAVDKGEVRTRLLSPREAARLMGLPETYALPERANAALKLCGDGVCVPAVQWLAENIFEPSLRASARIAA